jgi:Ca2+-binding RTX toxin-like protein
MLTYDEALAIINAAPESEFTLAPYTGAVDDQVYLRQWVTDLAESVYGVDANVFDVPTLGSTTLLRDLVHRALYQTSDPHDFKAIAASPQFLGYEDVAQSFRYPAHGLCSQMAWQLWKVYQSFGYSTTNLSTINGNVDDYDDSHVMVQVYLEDLGKEIVQDATFNFLYRKGDTFLSFEEARSLHDDPAMIFDSTGNYRDYYRTLEGQDGPSAKLQAYIRDEYLSTIAWWWGEGSRDYSIWNIFSDHPSRNSRDDSPGNPISTDQALARIASLAPGEDAKALVDQLGSDGYYASGFTVVDAAGAEHSWVTIKEADGSYLSLSLSGDPMLYGALDALEREAVTGEGPNSGTDLSLLLLNKSVFGTWFDFDPAQTTPRLSPSYGTDAGDTLTGGSGNDRLLGLDGNDVLHGGVGNDYLQGGRGDDIYFVDSAADRVSELLGEGYDTVVARTSYKLPTGTSVEMLRTTGSASTYAVNLTGNEFDNAIVGNAAANTLDGLGGADVMWGYGGNDFYFVDNVGDIVVERAGEGFDQIFVDNISSYTLQAGSEVEQLSTRGSATTFAVNLTGNELNNTIVGNSASNVIDGAAGADVMWGYGGNDFYYVDNSADMVVEARGDGYDTIYALADYRLPTGIELELLRTMGSASTYAVNLTGNEFNNVIVGNAATNIINGGTGVDAMWGYGGNDVYYVDNVGDAVVERSGEGYDIVYTTVSYALTGGSEIEELRTLGSASTNAVDLAGNEFDNSIIGNDATNVLNGGAGDDTLWGYAGNDILVGGAGKDVLNGGAGRDLFSYGDGGDSTVGAAGRDVIQDFVGGTDKIDLSALNTAQPLKFAAPSDAAASPVLDAFSVTYSWSDGATLVDIDLNGDRAADMQIQLLGQLRLSASDFIFA